MIAADTSTWIAFLEGAPGDDTQLLDQALADQRLLMIPAVLAELLSDPSVSPAVFQELFDIPMIDLNPGYWQRAGLLRAKVLSNRRKARLGDALIAQSCLDRDIPLLARDKDFRAFADAAGLNLLL
ncbi:MAG: PIN domain-containing protein [Candidatus Sulfotelmatobacter sp.]